MVANRKRLFVASFMTLIVAGLFFGLRASILGDWATQFGFTKSELGAITGGGFWTPASALGQSYLDRLQDKAGLRFESVE